MNIESGQPRTAGSDGHLTCVSVACAAAHVARPDWRFIDCRFSLGAPGQGRDEYRQGYIPGAIYAHLDDDLAGSIGHGTGRHPLPDSQQFADRLRAWGLDPAMQVVAYDATGGAIAARLWWMLRWMGHDRVAVLDGGFPAWVRAGAPVTASASARVPASNHAYNGRDGMMRSAAEVAAMLQAGSGRLFDARAATRFSGAVEPIDAVAGHIPGAVNLPFTGNLGDDREFLPPAALQVRFAAEPGSVAEVVHMCGSGVTACHNLLAMERAGLHGSRLYVGSWSEWIADPARPVATGVRP